MSTSGPSIHVEDLLPAFAAGATDELESERVSDHLATCDTCRRTLDEYEETLSLLNAAVPSVDPLDRVRVGLMERVAGVSGAAEAVPFAPALAGYRLPIWLAAGVGTAAGILGGLGLGGGFAYVLLRGDLERIEEVVGEERVVSYLAATPQTNVMVLEAQADVEMAEGAYAMLMAAPSGSLGVLVAGGLEILPRGQAYQLWVVTEGTRMDGGVFTVDAQGWGQVQFASPEPMVHIEQIGITIEPATGSSAPTGNPLLAWVQS